MPLIYHITTQSAWNEAITKGFYEADSLAAEGFIHCSDENQVEGVLYRYYTGVPDLVKLHIETDLLTSHLVFEWADSVSEIFPHIYGAINTDAVVRCESVESI